MGQVYYVNGKEYKQKELANYLGMSTTGLDGMLERCRGDIDKVIEILSKPVAYKGKIYESIDQLVEYINATEDLQITRKQLEFHSYKAERNIEKAMLLIKLNEIRKRKITIQVGDVGDINLHLEDLALLLGIQTRELVIAVLQGISIGEIRKILNDSEYNERFSFFKESIKSGKSFRRDYLTKKLFGLDNYVKMDTLMPILFQKYHIVFEKIAREFYLDYIELVSKIKKRSQTIEEIVEQELIKNISKEHNFHQDIFESIYSYMTSRFVSDKEKDEMSERLQLSQVDKVCINEVSENMKKIKRLIELNDIVQILKNGDLLDSDIQDLFMEHGITLNEIEIIVSELFFDAEYNRYEGYTDVYYKNKRISKKIMDWDTMSADERAKLEEDKELSQEDVEYIKNHANLLQHYKYLFIRCTQQQNQNQQNK